MKRTKMINIPIMLALFVMLLSACANTSEQSGGNEATPSEEVVTSEETATSEDTTTQEAGKVVEVTDMHGTVTVPVNPKRVVALDNRTFETLSTWGIELAAVPKAVMPGDISYVQDEAVHDIGNHREPNLEIIAALDPELVIVGQRFSSFYADIKALVPNAAVIDLTFDVSESAGSPGENLVNGLKDSTTVLGQIFDKTEEATQLNADFDQAIEQVRLAYNGTDTVMSVIVSGGDVNFSAPGSGRVWGPMYEIFGWVPALGLDNASSDHQGDDISVEAIAQSNPDWIFVLDRDAAISTITDALPAQDVIDESPALQNTKAVIEDKIIYAPADTYTNESIHTYLELFEETAKAFEQ